MFCSKCGKEIADEAVVCPNCGCATRNSYSTKNNVTVESQEQNLVSSINNLGTLSLVFAFFIPIVSIIFMIFGEDN